MEPASQIPIAADVDVCVVGGSCTGVFAAVRAARLGASVALVEMQNGLGGVATNGLVNVWHSLYDLNQKNQVIAGLTLEMLERLDKVGGLNEKAESMSAFRFNPSDLKIELDGLIKESKVKLFLHTRYSRPVYDGSKIEAVLIETKDGRRAIKAGFFIDATGDGDIARDLGIKSYVNKITQTPTACFLMSGSPSNINKLIHEHGKEVGIREGDWGWGNIVPGCDGLHMCAYTHVFDVLCSRTDDLTKAEVEGRRLARAVQTLVRKYGKESNYGIAATCSYIGIRETVHYESIYRAKGDELISCIKYPDAVMNGTYPSDIHDDDGGYKINKVQGDYYQLPFRVLPPKEYDNYIAVGRMINADEVSFGAIRVMVNLNQLGEAAGVAAFVSLDKDIPARNLDGVKVRETLARGGSAL